MRVEYGKISNFQPITRISQKRCKVGQSYYKWLIGSRIRPSIGAKINDLGWPWTADMHSIAEKMRLLEPTTKIWMKIDPYYQRQKCKPMTLVSGDIRFTPPLHSAHDISADSGPFSTRLMDPATHATSSLWQPQPHLCWANRSADIHKKTIAVLHTC